jgi:hypothetical protein
VIQQPLRESFELESSTVVLPIESPSSARTEMVEVLGGEDDRKVDVK